LVWRGFVCFSHPQRSANEKRKCHFLQGSFFLAWIHLKWQTVTRFSVNAAVAAAVIAAAVAAVAFLW